MPSETLKGWKEIAGFLRTSERTAHRWEGEFGMPVHRVPGKRGVLVFADPAELERWRTGRGQDPPEADPAAPAEAELVPLPPRPGRFRLPPVLALLGALGLCAAAAYVWRPAPRPPAVTTHGPGRSVLAFDVRSSSIAPPVSVMVPEGGLTTVEIAGGTTFGFAGIVEGKAVNLTVLSLAGGQGEVRQVGSLRLPRGEARSFEGGGLGFQVTWTGSKPASDGAPRERPIERCSISCDRLRVSAAAVWTSCGSCCDPPFCSETHWRRPGQTKE